VTKRSEKGGTEHQENKVADQGYGIHYGSRPARDGYIRARDQNRQTPHSDGTTRRLENGDEQMQWERGVFMVRLLRR